MFEVSVGRVEVHELLLGKLEDVSDIGRGKVGLKSEGVQGVFCEVGVEGGVELGEWSEELEY